MSTIAPGEWNLERLKKMISDGIEEGAQLDYKAAGALRGDNQAKIDITKDVSAFANSAGGTIIYGIREFKEDSKKHLPESIDPIDGAKFSREWLDQIVGQISPRIEGVKILPVRINPGSPDVCYVVEIPQSDTAHQATDFRYYRRRNFELQAMSDYEIRDVLNRRRHPRVEFHVKVLLLVRKVRIVAKIRNIGAVMAKNYKLVVLLPTVVNQQPVFDEGFIWDQKGDFKFWRICLGNINGQPLFPNSDVDLLSSQEFNYGIGYSVPHPTPDYLLGSLFADEMPCIERKIMLVDAIRGWA